MIDLDSRLAQGPLRVRSVWSEEPPERLAARILRRRRFMFALDAVAVCACLALLFIPLRRGLPLMSSMTSAPNAMVAGAPAIFADGSVAALSSTDAKLHIDEDTSNHVLAHLTGGARFEVVPNPKRAFEVQARDVRVRVLGTIFSVQELPQGHTQVLVERGRVEVAWLGGSTLLHAGEGGTFPPAVTPHDEPEAEEPASARDTAPDTAPDSSAPASRNANTNSPANRRSWRDYALNGDYGKAYDELHTKAGKGHEDVRDDVGDLMLAADVARLSAHPDQAVRPLRGVCERHANDRRAPVAAFTLGRVLLDELGRPSEAAAAFQKARRLWPEGPLAEDALAREADAWERAGRIERTRTLAREYVSRYPEGRHLAAMRKTLAQ